MSVIDEEYEINHDAIDDIFKKRCPIEVGDVFYHKKPNMTVPDRLKVVEIKEIDGTFFIRARYLYHVVGPFDRTFSDAIFKDPNWIIEK